MIDGMFHRIRSFEIHPKSSYSFRHIADNCRHKDCDESHIDESDDEHKNIEDNDIRNIRCK